MRVLVCGGRNFRDAALLTTTLDTIHAITSISCVVEGGAKGADALAAQWARANEIPLVTVAADWAVYGKAAGVIRNSRMLTVWKPALVVAFPGGAGTAHMVRIAREAGVEVREIT